MIDSLIKSKDLKKRENIGYYNFFKIKTQIEKDIKFHEILFFHLENDLMIYDPEKIISN